MSFAISRIAAAVGAAVAASAAVAAPYNPVANYTTANGDVSDVFLAGSSAVDLALTKFIANNCNANSLDVYRTDAGGKTYYLWACEVSSGFGKTKVAVHKNTNSSSDGVALVADGAANAAFLQVSDINPAACVQTTVAATATIPAYNLFTCGTNAGTAGVGTLATTAQIGFADSEPTQYNTTLAKQVTAAYPFSIIQGVPVTVVLRNALQASQGLVVGSEAAADVPSIASAQINAIYTGRYSNWTAALGVTLADNNVYKIRRSNGSGTSRAFFATFIGDTCVSGLASAVSGTTLVTANIGVSQCTAGGTKSLQAGTSDDVASCLSSFNAGGVGAIGYLSTDYTPTATEGYRFIKVDGVVPSVKNVADGKWKMWSELSMNYNKTVGVAGDVQAFYNVIKNASASPVLMSEVVQNLAQTTSGSFTGGVIGALANAKNVAGFGLPATASLGVPRTDASVIAAPANPLTRATSAGYNLCAPAFPASGYAAQ